MTAASPRNSTLYGEICVEEREHLTMRFAAASIVRG